MGPRFSAEFPAKVAETRRWALRAVRVGCALPIFGRAGFRSVQRARGFTSADDHQARSVPPVVMCYAAGSRTRIFPASALFSWKEARTLTNLSLVGRAGFSEIGQKRLR